MNRIKLLLVEDDPSLRMVMCETLGLEGFDCVCAADGLEGLQKFTTDDYDVVVADIMMPRLDGLDMVVRMRQRNRITPILFLTAKSSVDNVIEGFKAGADDYLRKPFSMRELIIRIQALYSRANLHATSQANNSSNLIPIGAYSFDPISQFLHFGDRMERLSSRESEILLMLANQVNTTVAAADIMKTLWGDDSFYVLNSLQVFITRLRQRLKDDPSVRIINARGVGYKLVIDLPSTL